MIIKQGTYGNIILNNKFIYIEKSGTTYRFTGSTLKNDISLNEVISADVIAQETATGGGVQGAAGGAVLGFLVLGPLGTMLGAGMGSKKKGRDATTISITFSNGRVWVAENPTPNELAYLKAAIAKNQLTANQTLEKKSSKKSPPKNQKKIAQRTAPPHKSVYRNESIKGRNSKKRKAQPDLSIFGLIASLNPTNPLDKEILYYLDAYHIYIWSHFDAMLSIDDEVIALAPMVLQNVFTLANQQKDLKKVVEEAEKSLAILEDNLLELMPLEETAKNNLLKANMFSKGKFRNEIKSLDLKIHKEKDAASAQKRAITTAKNKLKQLGDLADIPDLVDQIKRLNTILCPANKLNLKLKNPKKIDNQSYLDVYRSVFRKLEENRVRKEQDLIDKEFEAAKLKKDQKEKLKNEANQPINKKPIKERIKELKDLFDDGILEKDEYEEQRKRLLESI
jgi:hypothetical protein